MSNYEAHVGTLTKIETNLTPEEYCDGILKERKITLAGLTAVECYQDCFNDLLFYKDSIYSINDTKIGGDDDIFQAHEIAPGKIEYRTMFYNGGCDNIEALQIALDKMNKK